MSYDAMTGSDKPLVCEICGRELKDGEKILTILFNEVVHTPEGHDLSLIHI